MHYIFVFLSFVTLNYHTTKEVKYRYVVENKICIDSFKLRYVGMELEFDASRTYYNENTFEELGVLSSDIPVKFKKCGFEWFTKEGNTWKVFYKPSIKNELNFNLENDRFKLTLVDSNKVKGYKCFIYQLDGIDFSISNNAKYWFSPDLGIIKVDIDGTQLIRNDLP